MQVQRGTQAGGVKCHCCPERHSLRLAVSGCVSLTNSGASQAGVHLLMSQTVTDSNALPSSEPGYAGIRHGGVFLHGLHRQ